MIYWVFRAFFESYDLIPLGGYYIQVAILFSSYFVTFGYCCIIFNESGFFNGVLSIIVVSLSSESLSETESPSSESML